MVRGMISGRKCRANMAGMETSAEQGSQRQHLVPRAQVDWMIHMYAARRGGTLITEKARTTLAQYGCASELGVGAKREIEDFMRHAQRQIAAAPTRCAA